MGISSSRLFIAASFFQSLHKLFLLHAECPIYFFYHYHIIESVAQWKKNLMFVSPYTPHPHPGNIPGTHFC
jgi:hypothetical protein